MPWLISFHYLDLPCLLHGGLISPLVSKEIAVRGKTRKGTQHQLAAIFNAHSFPAKGRESEDTFWIL